MTNFILNRPDDSLTISRNRVIRTAIIWFAILLGCAIAIRIACVAVYMSMGLNPMELTKFGGDPTSHMAGATWRTLLKLMIVAPLAEEALFHLGLSFRRKTVALWIGLMPLIIAAYFHHCKVWYILLGLAALGSLLFWVICRYTTDEHWAVWRGKFIIPTMWISAIGFGLMHLIAFSVLNLQVLPFAIATILVPMAGGCAATYVRVNLGFWWGVLLHCIINVPGVLMIVASMI